MRKLWMILFMLLVVVPSVMAQNSNVMLAESPNGGYRVMQENENAITLTGTSLNAPLAIVEGLTSISAVVDDAANIFIIGVGVDGESQIVWGTFADVLTSTVTTTTAEEGEYYTRLSHGWAGQACVEVLRENVSSVSRFTRLWTAEDGNKETACDDRIQPQIEVALSAYAEFYEIEDGITTLIYDEGGRFELLNDAEAQILVTVNQAGSYFFSISGNEFSIGSNAAMPLSITYSDNTLNMVFPNGTYTATLQQIAGGTQITITEPSSVLSITGECQNLFLRQSASDVQFTVCEKQSTLELALLADEFGFLTETPVKNYAHYDLRENSACWIPMVLVEGDVVLDAAYALMSLTDRGNAQINRVTPVNTGSGTAYELESYDRTLSGRIPTAAWLVVKSNGLRGQFVAFQDLDEPTYEGHLCVADDN